MILAIDTPSLQSLWQEKDAPSIPADTFGDLEKATERQQANKDAATVPQGGGTSQDQRNEVGSCTKKTCMRCLKIYVYIYNLSPVSWVQGLGLWCRIQMLGYDLSFLGFSIKIETTCFKPCQTKQSLKKFLDSVLQKAGKIRGLIRDIKENYKTNSALQAYLHGYICMDCFAMANVNLSIVPLNCSDYILKNKFSDFIVHMSIISIIWGMWSFWKPAWKRWTRNTIHAMEQWLWGKWMDLMTSFPAFNRSYLLETIAIKLTQKFIKFGFNEPFNLALRFIADATAKMKAATLVCRPKPSASYLFTGCIQDVNVC